MDLSVGIVILMGTEPKHATKNQRLRQARSVVALAKLPNLKPENSPETHSFTMSLTIYHNPRCSKSRKTLEIIRENGLEPDIVEYLKTPPSADEILALREKLDMPLNSMLRTKEAEYREAGDLPQADDDAALAAWLSSHIRVLERPIVVSDDGRAVIGRPPENVLELLSS